jgi:cytochrome c peroxidase
MTNLDRQLNELREKINNTDCNTPEGRQQLLATIHTARTTLKHLDIWLRYLEPVAYNKINGQLPVEWENEVFEKFEKPYRRVGGGLSLAELQLRERTVEKDTLLHLINAATTAMNTFKADSITRMLRVPGPFLLANRLMLLNLAAIYTTGFECPDKERIVPELLEMVKNTEDIYKSYNATFAEQALPQAYMSAWSNMIAFVKTQPNDYRQFDHYTFVKDHVNPLFAINQRLIQKSNFVSTNYNDYTLNDQVISIFDKHLYASQNTKGVYSLVKDEEAIEEFKHIGKLLFYDPILSGNNQRTCASCHKSAQCFTDTTATASLQFNHTERLARNTPSLVNVVYNHLIMLDGKHITLQAQGKAVITNPIEMGGDEKAVMEKIMSCKEYRTAFKKFLKLIPEEKEVTFDHVVSAITAYDGDFSNYYGRLDLAMNNNVPADAAVERGFNVFMGKAQCGTCHYLPQFNGVKPPYISSDFESIGVPADKAYSKLSADKGRYVVNPAPETEGAFRTGTVRNAALTAPYMHNGVFTTLAEVIDFYDGGGGAGHQLAIANQTLAADSLHLTANEKQDLISFINALTEDVVVPPPPDALPKSDRKELNGRKPGGEY